MNTEVSASLLQTAGNLRIPNPARVYDALLGGKDNFAVDRAVADRLTQARPALRWTVLANRAYLVRAVRYLAAKVGVRQFLDLGTGLPAQANTHEVAQSAAPDARIVYVDSDPCVIVHARALLVGGRAGATSHLQEDIRDPKRILEQAADTLDFSDPVAILMLSVLDTIPDADRPYETVAAYLAAAARGSYLAISHPASDVDAEQAQLGAREFGDSLSIEQTNRTRNEVAKFFAGLELIEPGVVPLNKWRPDPDDTDPGIEISSWAGLGRKN
jgi:hypothetical protein